MDEIARYTTSNGVEVRVEPVSPYEGPGWTYVPTTCSECGHTAADHADGILGASINDTGYCHTDDHSCYGPAQRAYHADPTTWPLLGFLEG